MKNSILKIKSYFSKRFSDEEAIGEVSLENGKTFRLIFDPNKRKIVVESPDKENKQVLSVEERTAIIEVIISELLGFFKSILKASIRYEMERFTLVDNTTNENIDTKDNIILEFVKSPFAYETENNTLKLLLNMYTQIDVNREKIGKEDIYVRIPKNTLFYKFNAIHFLIYTLLDYAEIAEIKENKSKNEVVIKALKNN